MKYARIIDNVAIEAVDFDPAVWFTADVATLFTEVPDNVVTGSTFDGEEWADPPVAEPVEPTPPPPAPLRKELSPVEFKLQFTSTERLAIRAARDVVDASGTTKLIKDVLDDFFSIIEDPRLTMVDLNHPATIEGVEMLGTSGLIDAERAAVILAGV